MLDISAEIEFNDRIARDTYLMGLQAPEILSHACPGQFVMLRLGTIRDPLLRRPFSICGALPGGVLLILYKVIGRGTKILSRAAKNDRLSLLGPLGSGFAPPRGGERALLVAGGLGIAPILFLAQSLEGIAPRFLAGFRCAAEAIPVERINVKRVEIVVASDDGSIGHRGMVTDLLDAHAGPDPAGSLMMYACGPRPMLGKVAAWARNAGVRCQVSLETYMACGLGACQGCAVKTADPHQTAYHLVCREGPVFSSQAIDWNTL